MTQWYAFKMSANVASVVTAANRLHYSTGADAFCVMETFKVKVHPKQKVRKPVVKCVLPTYVIAGFDHDPNFLAIEQMPWQLPEKRLKPVRFGEHIEPLNNHRDLAWITEDLPGGLHRHYEMPRFMQKRDFQVGDYIRNPFTPAERIEVLSVDGEDLITDLIMLGKQFRIPVSSAVPCNHLKAA